MKIRNIQDDFHRYMCWKRKSPIYINYYLSPEERHELIDDAGIHGLVLFEYYLMMANQKDGNEEISDQRAANWLKWSVRTAKRHRLALQQTDWLLIEKYKGTHNDQFIYFLGKPMVQERKLEIAQAVP